jgi:hypothetical protein
MDKVLIPAGLVDDDELDVLVKQIATMKCADAEIEKQFVVTNDSPSLLAALRALFGDHTVKAEKRVKRNIERVQRRSKMVQDGWKGNGNGSKPEAVNEPKPAPTRGPHVRSIELDDGEKISRFELNKRLSEKTIEPGTWMHSPKHGRIKVSIQEDALVLVNEAGDVVK